PFDVVLSSQAGRAFFASEGLRGRHDDEAPGLLGRIAFADREWTMAGQIDGLWQGASSAAATLVLWFGLFLAVPLIVVMSTSEALRRRAVSLAEANATVETSHASLERARDSLQSQHEELRAKETELLGAAREKRRVLDSLAAFLVGVDSEGRVVEWNSVASA